MKRFLVVLAALGLVLLGSVSASGAELASFTASTTSSQAGAHADSNVSFVFQTETALVPAGGGFLQPCLTPDGSCTIVKGGTAKDIVVDLPSGMSGNPENYDTCSFEQLAANACSQTSQVGVSDLRIILGGSPDFFQPRAGVFNMVPDRGEVAKLGMNVIAVPVFLSLTVRPDGGLRATVHNVFDGLPLWASSLTIWGVPSDPIHDPARACDGTGGNQSFGCSLPQNVTRQPFLANGAQCGASQSVALRVNTWQHPDQWVAATSSLAPLTGCDVLDFRPSIDVKPTNTEREQPTGLDVDLAVPPAWSDPDGVVTPPLRTATVTLPEGVSINPSSADGLVACTDAELNLGNDSPVACPDASKIGDLSLETPLIPDVLTGGIYLRPQASNDPASGNMFRIALEISSFERGINLKVPGQISLDPNTGRVTTTFEDAPQLPFSALHLHFMAGPRAPLALPNMCGTATATATLTGWGMSSSSDLTSSFDITHNGSAAPCPRGFSPTFTGGSLNAAAGKDTTFTTTFGRSDDDQDLKGISLQMPPGLLGRIAKVPLCADAQANLGTCGEASRIGKAMTGAGAGSNPFFLPGRVYLTGPYKGAPFGLSIVVPALAGPFDLGTVVVRAAIQIDRKTAALTVVSNDLPTILKGVPLRLRRVSIDIDRPGFMFNPTNCDPLQVSGQITSTEGATANIGSHFEVYGCRALVYKPRLSIRVGGKGHTAKGKATPVSVTLRSGAGQANNRSVTVTLPGALNARLGVVSRACSLAEFQAGNCAKAKAGSAVANTPVLAQPLTGNVYFVKNPKRSIPDLMVALRGQVDVDLVGKVSIPGGKLLKTQFDTIPDVPITSFTLKLSGGRNGPVGVARNLCSRASKRAVATVGFRAQNGMTASSRQRLHIAGCRK